MGACPVAGHAREDGEYVTHCPVACHNDSESDEEDSEEPQHADEVRARIASLYEQHEWRTDPEVENALVSSDLREYRRILREHQVAEPRWDEALHGAFRGDKRVRNLAAGGFVTEGLSVYTVLTQLLYPAIVAAGPRPRVLDVGCGTGFLTAVLARLVAPRGGSVIAIDLFARQVEHAQRTMSIFCPELLPLVTFACGDGPEFRDPTGRPFAAVAVAAQSKEVPLGLVAQLAPRGRLVVPVGSQSSAEGGKKDYQRYWLVEKGADGAIAFSGRAGPISVNFVPLLPGSRKRK
eukprot:TRINITY_DN63321_c0_g1_i1.p1 TRINITY_DN63321_c0_g1~~TRINITY_DN63321_c0_g1_i1.p1  ORF type:complete len:313 (+),score=48.02 TRINITY_DN63321_c0_g1_i1:65-940(+)